MTKLCEKCFNPLNWTGATVKHSQFTYEPRKVCEQQAEIVRWRVATGRHDPEEITYTQDLAVFWQRKAELYATQREEARKVAKDLHWSLGRTDWESTKDDALECNPWLGDD